MPTSEPPAELNDPKGQPGQDQQDSSREKEVTISGSFLGLDTVPLHVPETEKQEEEPASPVVHGSRWVDYDTHELLELISELEDERRWSRLREGALWAVLLHIFVLSAATWIPTYVFKAPKVVDPFDAIRDRKDLTYLDMPPDVLRKSMPKPKPLTKQPTIDKKTMDEMKKQSDAQQQAPQPQQQQQQQQQAQEQPKIVQPQAPAQQAQTEAPRPAPVPAKPNFAMGSQNPADKLREAMRGSMHSGGQQEQGGGQGGGRLSRHPGAGTGGVDILSDTQGVDFSSWMTRWHFITERTWDPLIPDEVNPPILKSGVVVIRFKVLPNGQVTDMRLDGRSGDTALDRAAWGAITGSSYPALPRDFHGPYLELRAYFLYNMERR